MLKNFLLFEFNVEVIFLMNFDLDELVDIFDV